MTKKNRLDRREFLKLEAAAMAAAAGGLPAPVVAQNLITDRSFTELKWNKAPCRFCGTGCGVMVATRDGRVVATHGDTQAEVNRGLNCVKGYFLSKIMYGHDRLTHPLLRKKNGKYDKNGEFTQVSWDEAFDMMAQQFKSALAKRGPSGVGMFGSGQWTSGKAMRRTSCSRRAFGLTTSIRMRVTAWRRPSWDSCGRSAWTSRWAAMTTSRPQTLSCCGARTWRRCTPILWSRVTDRRLSAPHVRVAVLSTFEHRSFDLADIQMVFTPQTDLAILNAIANHIISTNRVNKDFVRQTYGFQARTDRHRLRIAAGKPVGAEGFRSFEGRMKRPTLHSRSMRNSFRTIRWRKPRACPVSRSIVFANSRELYADPKTKVVSFWTMGFNQHTRGVWCNNLVYNIHLLNRKDFGARQQSVLAHRPTVRLRHGARGRAHFRTGLPADMLVANKEHRDIAEKIWKLPEGTIAPQPGYHAVLQNRMLRDGKLNAYWVQVNNNLQAAANVNEEAYPGLPKSRRTSSLYPTPIRP